MDIVVLASGNGSTFQAIHEQCEHINIRAVISDVEDAYVLTRAKEARIPYQFCQHDKILECVASWQPDLVVLAGYMRILDKEFLKLLPNTINIHPSLLPKHRGLNTHQRVLDAKECEHGTTIHWVTDELDAGVVIAQEKIPVWQMDTADILQDKVQEIERAIYPKILDEISTGAISLPVGA
jgi:phosphoribosylglycinamide formyltransferase-1